MNGIAFVTAVSGISGAGKTSVVERTVDLLGNAARLSFDDYRSVSTYPADLGDWLDRGADLDEWKTPRLVEDLLRLRSGEPVEMPEGRGIVEPKELILLEEPFGRSRPEMTGLIDLAAHLELPADVLLARRLLRRLDAERDDGGDGPMGQIRQDLNLHLRVGRELDERGNAAIRQTADLILDGMKTVDELAAILVAEIKARNGSS